MIDNEITKLMNYAVEKGLVKESDRIYVLNNLLDIFNLDEYEECQAEQGDLQAILSAILDWAVEKGLTGDGVVERDLFDTKVMGAITPKPSEINEAFGALYQSDPQSATEYFYKLCCDSDYIRRYRIQKDIKWVSPSLYGDLDITINLSKPEKDPKAIAAAKYLKQSGYPKCMLCKENIGYKGRLNHPARQNLRAVPVTINGEEWFFQYSPYVYYNEHCIVFNGRHVPMKIDKSTFRKLLDFVTEFPHYFVGSNADLPIVGGSILTHDHFQGGNYTFAMAKAPIEKTVRFIGFEDVSAGIVKWPMSVIRLCSADSNRLVELSDKLLTAWREYTDEQAFVFAESDCEPHNTITPIARQRNGLFEMDLVLRNNITTAEHPMGVYHPHSELHHIKKENIGLIEVMGLAVLPARLKEEMALLGDCLAQNRGLPQELAIHAPWAEELKAKYGSFSKETIEDILHTEIGLVFAKVLEHAGVYKCDEQGRAGFMRFLTAVGGK